MRVVARRTGLSPHVIRVWEKRYAAVSPARTPTNRRVYSEADIERLTLLRRATQAGHSIGQIAQLPTRRLRALAETDEVPAPPPLRTGRERHRQSSPPAIVEACLAAVHRLDTGALEATLARAAVELSQLELLECVIAPALQGIGMRYREGSLRVAHEHLASSVMRAFLGTLRAASPLPPSAPTLIVTTPAGQLHELGALMVAISAEAQGWRVTYLGPNLPPEEIAGAARQNQARAVALSIVYPADDPHLRGELQKLRRYLAKDVALVIGGRAAEAYADTLDDIGAKRLADLTTLPAALEWLRSHHTGEWVPGGS